ncbi:MAG TPA: hypothetical protein VG603_05165 [Chitinophagales bacterium]|nr:hypothetical protein [Chitinophagales bacterium]
MKLMAALFYPSFLRRRRFYPALLIIPALLVAFAPAYSQTEKGRYMVGGSGDISESFNGVNSNFNFSLSPSFGVFVVKNFAVGGIYSFTIGGAHTYNVKKGEYVNATTFTAGIGPQLKYFLGKKAVKGFASASAAYAVYTRLSQGDVTNLNGFSVGGMLGVAYFFNNYISLETGFYLTGAGYQYELPTTRAGLSIGLYGFLDKKKAE